MAYYDRDLTADTEGCVCLMVPCHHTCHRATLCTLRLPLSVPAQTCVCVCVCVCGCVCWGGGGVFLKCAIETSGLWLPLVLCARLPLSGATFLLTSDIAVLSHSSKLHLKHLSLFLPTHNNYAITPTGWRSCEMGVWEGVDDYTCRWAERLGDGLV